MSFIAESRRNNLWFGTEQRMLWFPTPNTGADVSPAGWEVGGSFLNGGGFQLNSFGSHKNYIFEWPQSSARETAQLMKSFSDGSYGRGFIYFIDPLIYDTNIFPAMWADPSIGVGYEGASLVNGVEPTPFPTTGWETNLLPITSAFYDLAQVSAGWRGKEEAVFLPIPEGHTLRLGAIHSRGGTGRVFYRTQASNGGLGGIVELPALGQSVQDLTSDSVSSVAGVWVWVGRNSGGTPSVTLSALTARLYKTARPRPEIGFGPWIGGQGHSGCRFVSKPTYIENTGVGGGQVSFAASFIEVGSWAFG